MQMYNEDRRVRKSDRQTDRQRHADRWKDSQICKKNGYKDKQTQSDRQKERQTDRRRDRQTDTRTVV